MGRTQFRALGLRASAFFIPLGILLALVASMPGANPPWPLLIGFFGVFGAIVITTSVFTDRRLSLRAGRGDAPWIGAQARWAAVETAVPITQAVGVARDAIRQAGGRDLSVNGDSIVVGWIGTVFTNLPQWQQYELAIVISPASNGGTQFICCARPRFSTTFLGGSRSYEIVSILESEIESLARV